MHRRHAQRIAGTVLAALALAGCEDEDPTTTQGTMPFKSTNTASLESLRNDMQKNMRTRAYMKKSGDAGQAAAESGGVTGPRPAAEARPATPSKPGPESRPAGETKPGTESQPATHGK